MNVRLAYYLPTGGDLCSHLVSAGVGMTTLDEGGRIKSKLC